MDEDEDVRLRKIRTIAALSALVALATPVASHAAAATTTLYFHSASPVANLDHQEGSILGTDGTTMTAEPPSKSEPSVGVSALTGTYPNHSIYGPAWRAPATGTITGPASVTFWATSAASRYVAVNLYVDEDLDNDNYTYVARSRAVLAAGGPAKYTVNFNNLNVPVAREVIVQVVGDTAAAKDLGDVEILYDSTAYPSAFTFTLNAATPPPPPPPTVTPFALYRAPDTFANAHGPNETSIGVNPTTGSVLFQMVLDTARVTFDDTVVPAKATWTNVTNAATSQDTHDPYLFTDRTTGRTFVLHSEEAASVAAYTDDDGRTWKVTQPPSAAPSYDHESLGGGSGKPYYYCAQGLVVGQCARSDDGGATWGAPVAFNGPTDVCFPIHGRVTVGADGTVYVPVEDCQDNGQGIYVSHDAGATWQEKYIPGTVAGNSDPAVALDAAGRLYYAAASGGSIVVSTSTDSGNTFKTPVNVGALAGIKQAEFASAVAGDAGKAAVAFYGSTTPGDDQDADYTGAWYLYVATTLDGGQTWTVVNVTPGDPVQRGWICMSGLACTDGRNLLDFQSIGLDPQGRVLVGFADGCTTNACIAGNGKTGAQAGSTDSWASIARQQSGPRLRSATAPVATTNLG